jgi:hypothetical protein
VLRVTAFAPGIGRVGTTLPSDTEVQPPGYIPPPERTTYKDDEDERRREYRLAGRARRPDVGLAEKIKRIKHDCARGLFLRGVATSRPTTAANGNA